MRTASAPPTLYSVAEVEEMFLRLLETDRDSDEFLALYRQVDESLGHLAAADDEA